MKVTERIAAGFGTWKSSTRLTTRRRFRSLEIHDSSNFASGELIEYICQENNKDVQHLVGK